MRYINLLHRSHLVALALALTFAAGAALAVDLPANYTRLDWIESDKTAKQWIDSGYHPKSSTVIRASILARTRSENWAFFFGVMKDDSPDNSVVLRYLDGGGMKFDAIFCNTALRVATFGIIPNSEYDVELKSGSLKVAGAAEATLSIPTVNEPVDAPLYIFTGNYYKSSDGTSSGSWRPQPMRLYSMTISEDDALKRDFIPCINADGAYGLWDAVEGKFYANKGNKGDFTGGVIYNAAANEKLAIPNASGTMELRGADAATSEFEVESLASGSLVYVPNDSRRVTIDSAGEGVNIIVRKIPSSDAPVTLALPAGQVIDSLTIEDGVTVYLESGSVGSFEGTGKLVVQGVVGYGTISDGIDVKIEADASMSNILDDALASALGDVPALWLDASDETTLQEYSYNGHTVPDGTFPGIVVRCWNDCREGEGRAFAVSARSATYYPSSEPDTTKGGYIRTMPFSIPNALNGLSVLSFGAYCETDEALVTGYRNAIDSNGNGIAENNRHEQRRMMFSRPIQSKSIIMVYGSQEGGGKGLVGGWQTSSADNKYPIDGEVFENVSSNTGTYYNRSDATTASTVLAAGRPNVPCWVDGKAIVPNETAALNGGYQIISLGVAPGDSPSVRSIGMADQANNAGGQRYGEILIFTNELTTVQRKAVEFYLAKKWGLAEGYSAGGRPRSLEIADGGSFETVDSAIDISHSGGTISVCGALEAGGVAVGSVSIAEGASLTLPAADPFTEEQVDAVDGRIARFDPDCTDDIFFNNQNDQGIRLICDHGKGDVEDATCLYAYYNGTGNDRRPVWSKSARGFGPERGWMDFFAWATSSDVKGDNLRFTTSGNSVRNTSANNNPTAVAKSIKTAFIVMDSCYGGGLPIIDKVSPDGSSIVRGRSSYTDPTAPIWGSGTSQILTGGETRINGMAVDGTKTGFTGAPELFSFTTNGDDFNASYFGLYNAGNPERSYEVLGEIVVFSKVLDDETRGGIEAYLMKKWLNMLPPGYADWTGATVSGAGTVKAQRPKDLPQFENFTGTLEFTAATLPFTLDGETKTALDAFDIGDATLKLPAEGEIVISFAGRARIGTYTLGTFGSLVAPGIADWTCTPCTADGRYKIRVKVQHGSLVADVVSSGLNVRIR